MKQFTSYPLTTNTKVNLLAIQMICELLIHNIDKENEARNMKQFILAINKTDGRKLTHCIDDVWIVDSHYHQRN